VWSIVQAAGWPIWPLIFASVVALALILERLWSLRKSVVAPPDLVDRVLTEYRQNGATPELITRTAQHGPLGRILAAGLANVKSPRPVIKEVIEEVGRVVTHDLERFLTTLGTIAATRKPFVVLTSNATRELSEALKRRCLFLHMDYPDAEREKAIVLRRVPEVPEALAEQLVRTIRTLRALELKKAPSIAESIDWARTLVALNADELDEATVASTLGVVLKHASDQTRAAKELGLSG